MTMLATDAPRGSLTVIGRLVSALRVAVTVAPQPPEICEDDDRARMAFMFDMLDANPNAFARELDVQNMMHCFPGRF